MVEEEWVIPELANGPLVKFEVSRGHHDPASGNHRMTTRGSSSGQAWPYIIRPKYLHVICPSHATPVFFGSLEDLT